MVMTSSRIDEPTREDRRSRQSTLTQAVRAVKAHHAAKSTFLESLADDVARWASSPLFVLFHVVWFSLWIGWNTGLFGTRPFDPFPFGLLTMVVSLEAIFLSLFILTSQAREASIAELREETALQVMLKTEAEVTKTLQLVAGLYTRLGHQIGEDEELREMLRPLDSERIETELLQQLKAASRAGQARRIRLRSTSPPATPTV